MQTQSNFLPQTDINQNPHNTSVRVSKNGGNDLVVEPDGIRGGVLLVLSVVVLGSVLMLMQSRKKP